MSTLITTPMYYTNGEPHIGHSYTSIVADFLARWQRLNGEEVLLITGTDEHGQKIEQASAKLGKTPIELCDEMSSHFQELCKILNLSQDKFIRTTEERHKATAQSMWILLNDYIYKGKYKGWYSMRDESYYAEEELVEKNGKKFAPTNSPVEWLEEDSYFFKLSAFQKPLLEFYNQNPNFIYPESRYNEVKRFIEKGLKDLCISRSSLTWGVAVPQDSNHVMYVWLDALSSYISVLDYPNGDLFKKFWLKGEQIHILGKDIIRFHGVYWIAFLMAAKLPYPKKIISHGWWKHKGEKMSKSVGNVVDPVGLVHKYSTDYLRYFLLREVKLSTDGNFSEDLLLKRAENDLADNLGNLVYRTLSIVKKHCNGKLGDCSKIELSGDGLMKTCQELVQEYQIKLVLLEIMKFLKNLNRYVDEQKPWNLAKEGKEEKLNQVLGTVIKGVRQSLVLLQPAIPKSAGELLTMLDVPKNKRSFDHYLSLNSGGEFTNFEVIFRKFSKI